MCFSYQELEKERVKVIGEIVNCKLNIEQLENNLLNHLTSAQVGTRVVITIKKYTA